MCVALTLTLFGSTITATITIFTAITATIFTAIAITFVRAAIAATIATFALHSHLLQRPMFAFFFEKFCLIV
ncbi:hypothetical protein DERF_007883 [Dermatophagoides farinae]|uniref:Uncharacterized protein n=1 Tax=Dermatophagoides farinae TaxID=6954 RepID=A0A922I1B8_DERFA|nr:hypothetical protein DERF_007883 [Dermatophagoides farinae]